MPDSFGFNPPVVQAYQERYGIDILTDKFDPDKLCTLNSELFTGFLRRVRGLLGPERKMIAPITLKGWYGYGGPAGRAIGATSAHVAPMRISSIPNPKPLREI